MKRLISLALLGATSSLMALDAEHAYLYKDPRVMGMGGANVAVGGYSTSVFSNPAGLAKIKKSHGFVVDLLGLGVSVSDKFEDFATDLDDVETDTDTNPNATSDIVKLLKNYSGDHFHFGVDNYTAISKNSDAFAWSLGVLAAADINYKVHANGGTSFLETSSRSFGGVILGGAKPYETDFGRLDVGVSLKYISQISYEGGLTVNELLDDDVQEKFKDKYEETSSGFGVDIGATLYPFEDSYWHPAIGFSLLNIGSMSMDDNYGGQPMTLNVGMSISPDVSIIESLVVAVDYVDALNANQVRFYNLSGNTVNVEDIDEDDYSKRLRLGVGLGLIDSSFLSMALNAGMYQGAYTAGVNLEMTMLKINVATYQEEIGTGNASNTDRRYIAKLGFGW